MASAAAYENSQEEKTPTEESTAEKTLDVENKNKKEKTALVFDCGTGETKAILYKYKPDAEIEISATKVGLKDDDEDNPFEAVIDGIESCDNMDDEQTDEKLQAMAGTMSEVYCKACEYNGKDSGKTDGKKIDYVIVGASAWARKCYSNERITRIKNEFMLLLANQGLFPRVFNQADEAGFERLSTIYAFSCLQDTGVIDPEEKFCGVLAAGGGSCQFSFAAGSKGTFSERNLDIGSKGAIDYFVEAAKKNPEDVESPLAALDDWLAKKRKIVKLHWKQSAKVEGFYILISGMYYAAKEIQKTLKGCKEDFGTLVSKDDEATYVLAGDIKEAARKHKEQVSETWKSMTPEERTELMEGLDHKNKKKIDGWAKDLANTAMCAMFWDEYFEDSAKLCFKRNWELGSGSEKTFYRSTWTAGWFIQNLQVGGIDFVSRRPNMKTECENVAEKLSAIANLVTKFRLDNARIANVVNDMVASEIAQVKELANKHREIAKDVDKELVAPTFDKFLRELGLPKLKDVEEGCATGLSGYAFRIKSKESLERKIEKVIADLVAENMDQGGLPSYSPLESEILRKLRDVLRFTLVLSKEEYYNGVKVVEKNLIEENWSYTAKNYWTTEGKPGFGDATYMGLNMNLLSSPDPIASDFVDDRYPIELQIHTPESFKVKSEESHHIFEDIRTERVPKRKEELVEKLCNIWKAVPCPELDGESFASYLGIQRDGEEPPFTQKVKTFPMGVDTVPHVANPHIKVKKFESTMKFLRQVSSDSNYSDTEVREKVKSHVDEALQ